MPLDANLLGQNMLNAVRSEILAKHPQAVAQPFQVTLLQAISKGVVQILKTTAVSNGISPAPVVTGIGTGITVDNNLMLQSSRSYLIGQVGQIGEAFELIAGPVMQSIKTHLLQTTVQSVSGFGGQPGLILNFTEPVLTGAIQSNLPTQVLVQMQQSEAGLLFIKALSTGIVTGVSSAQVGLVPFGSTPPPPGLLVAKFS